MDRNACKRVTMMNFGRRHGISTRSACEYVICYVFQFKSRDVDNHHPHHLRENEIPSLHACGHHRVWSNTFTVIVIASQFTSKLTHSHIGLTPPSMMYTPLQANQAPQNSWRRSSAAMKYKSTYCRCTMHHLSPEKGAVVDDYNVHLHHQEEESRLQKQLKGDNDGTQSGHPIPCYGANWAFNLKLQRRSTRHKCLPLFA